jgi:hypothetical protein
VGFCPEIIGGCLDPDQWATLKYPENGNIDW